MPATILNRRQILTGSAAGAAGSVLSTSASSESTANIDSETFDTVMAFMEAMGKGDTKAMAKVMTDDMVWHNEGDKTLPWIGRWQGKDTIFSFLATFAENVEIMLWDTQDAFASGDTLAAFGQMNLKVTKNGQETGPFNFALRAKVREGKVASWTWFEDSFAMSQAYNSA